MMWRKIERLQLLLKRLEILQLLCVTELKSLVLLEKRLSRMVARLRIVGQHGLAYLMYVCMCVYA